MYDTQQEAKSRLYTRNGDEYSGSYNSYSGADIVAYIHIQPQESVTGTGTQSEPVLGILGNLQTISYSTFRDVAPVRSLGRTYSDGYTRGPRTVAGTMVWTVLDQHVLAQALGVTNGSEFDASSILVDQLPPFDVVITFNNEYGSVAKMGIYGIRMVNEGATFSIDDMITEQTNSFVAADIDMIHKGTSFRNGTSWSQRKTGTDILLESARLELDHGRTDR